MPDSLDFTSLRTAYASGADPQAMVESVYSRIAARGNDPTWLHVVPMERALEAARALADIPRTSPLWGIPFAIKDNIDLAGAPTTAACPAFAYTPDRSARVVERLIAAGAIPIGKTNLDQFATGLVGVRSPYGVPENTFDRRYIPGGSSSGSATAVAAGLVSFALGTDTAGSGRVPAGFNNLVGLKPTKGLLSTTGLVPACRTLDVISVLALTVPDALAATRAAAGFDPADPYSRAESATTSLDLPMAPAAFRFGVPKASQLRFFGDVEAERQYGLSLKRLAELGGQQIDIDYEPFRETADLLYEGPWVAERYAAIERLMQTNPKAVHPTTRAIIGKAGNFNAVATFRALYRLEELKRRSAAVWSGIDVMALPTSGTIFTLEQLAAEPIRHNTELGYYTNFVNLLDLSALAVPSGMRADGLPTGITLIGPAWHDAWLAGLGHAFHRSTGLMLGATGIAQPASNAPAAAAKLSADDRVRLAVVGAHLSGMPLNSQLLDRGGRLVRTARTASSYRLFALADTAPPKPGLERIATGGRGIEIEIWDMPVAEFGAFVALVPPPLAIGSIEIDDGSWCKGFVCEPAALRTAKDITRYGGWRAYMQDIAQQ
ncbi:MAG: allophanate hydrolase [Alphaproteobacteria bacterium]|nr:allophanate hydrolase [Alphaproteobacteria bacterium]